jgi:hypothetical protein
VARHYDPELQAFYLRLVKRGKHHKVAICALAAKILRRCVAILRDGRPYEVEHQSQMTRKQNEEGKKVRESVHEVAKLLNDSGKPSSLESTAYAQAVLGTTASGAAALSGTTTPTDARRAPTRQSRPGGRREPLT